VKPETRNLKPESPHVLVSSFWFLVFVRDFPATESVFTD